jgi:hypothetical protein
MNAGLRPIGFELVRAGSVHDWDDPRTFLPFQDTLARAAAAGLRVSDYIDEKHAGRGSTQKTLDEMAALGVFAERIERVCEIGPGSGRYLEKTLKACRPSQYEIYETASAWANWLVEKYGVIYRPTDGKTLSGTPSQSVDLVQAHKVFVATPSMITCRYLIEMARVVRDRGKVVFDIVTEDCMDDRSMDTWLASGIQSGPYPAIMPKRFVVDLMTSRGLTFRGSFFVEMKPGKTECMVFVRSDR